MNEKKINIVNFVRGCDPRQDSFEYLYRTAYEEIKMIKSYGFKHTYLLQYDAMLRSEIQELFLKEKDNNMELGIWLEMAQPLCEKVGIPWRGRDGWAWDWHVNPDFLAAYTYEEKVKLIDEIMEYFHDLFGSYPKSAGSWILDSESMEYMHEKFGVIAFCICRDQYGTDGYTLWGGYYDGAYYPSKNHMLHPAQTKDAQVDAPVFRMLGSDLIYQYDNGFTKGSYNMIHVQTVDTMEPCCECGKSTEWVRIYFKNMIENEDMGFSYVQMGQENSFGWDQIKDGLVMQLDIIKELGEKVQIEKMEETGKWFRENYSVTPPTARAILDDWKNQGNQSVWFNCKNYRADLFSDGEQVWIRDIQLFSQKYRDRYLDEPCRNNEATFEALPIMDGYKWSNGALRAGIYLNRNGKIGRVYKQDEVFYVEINAEHIITFAFTEDSITVTADDEFSMNYSYYEKDLLPEISFGEKNIRFEYKNIKYALELESGIFNGKNIKSQNNQIKMIFE